MKYKRHDAKDVQIIKTFEKSYKKVNEVIYLLKKNIKLCVVFLLSVWMK